MRIGILFPSIYASLSLFPDKIFAPRELVIDLVNGLVEHGHIVTLYSAADLETRATLISEPLDGGEHPPEYHKFRGLEDAHRRIIETEYAKHRFELRLISRAFADAGNRKLDILHVFLDSSMFLSHYLEDLGCPVPVVYTLHDPLPPQGSYEFEEFSRFSRHKYISISNSFRQSDIKLNFVDTIYHGIDLTNYPYNETPSDHFLFMGRCVPEKGLHSALAATKLAGATLLVSTNYSDENHYYQTLKEELHEPSVTLLPVVDQKKRIELYRQARALLFPIEWEEPFGIVLVEAMAVGTPVVAFGRGSVPEIVVDGVTGFIVDTVEKMATAMGKITSIKRSDCRKIVEEKFSIKMMVNSHEKLYQKLGT